MIIYNLYIIFKNLLFFQGEFPMMTLPPEDKLHRRCSDASKELELAWQYLLPSIID